SFLESGRAGPSREMILRLAGVLDLPLRQQNALLLAAGFAPAWGESDLSAPEIAQVNNALDYMLTQQEPYPAFVVDRRWTLLRGSREVYRCSSRGRRSSSFIFARARRRFVSSRRSRPWARRRT